ncbi:MBL fold metallo-hydrolase [Pannonibacter sp. P2PFMT1]|uniref:MBL fold metallo-hydrolase n=1 Tax=Pannonibacter sp. P2PFMT1 TaxID=2003582 RepID=UPI001645E925|nr:MBL fold metallo-hydrolase [Pannonibacter sp. P2PFMT1]
MRVRIHRGTKEIGGSCIELEAGCERLLLDLGLPLDGDPDDISVHPTIDGLDGKTALRALILSHGHLDHWGLAHLAGPELPVALGTATHRIFQAAAPFLPRSYVPENTLELRDRTPMSFGPFKVTPYLVDHSAFDAYAFEVEADGKKLFYSGDFRAHGRKAALFEKLVANPPRNVDVLLMEGSTLGRLDAEHKFPTETEIELKFIDLFKAIPGMALVAASAQNIDRMVSLYRACKRTGRTLVIDLYAAEVLRATGNANIPQSDWPNMAVYVPHYQRVRIKQTERFDLLEPHKTNRIFAEDLKALAPKAAFLFRPAMLSDLDRAECLEGAVAVWSQWDGYLKQEKGMQVSEALNARGIRLEHAHTSGHASIADLKRLAAALAPRMLVPIHTFEPHRFPEHFGTIAKQKNDGEWWEIAA